MEKFKYKDNSFNEYSNKPGGSNSIKWKSEFQNILEKINIVLNLENYREVGDSIYFKIIYKMKNKIIPKTSRFIFRNKILSNSDIPQRAMKLDYLDQEEDAENKFVTTLTYKISKKEHNSFLDSIKVIKNIYLEEKMNEEYFSNLNSKNKELINKIELVDSFKKIEGNHDDFAHSNGLIYVEFIIEKDIKYTIEKIYFKTGIKIDIDEYDLSAFVYLKDFHIIASAFPELIFNYSDSSTHNISIKPVFDESIIQNKIDEIIENLKEDIVLKNPTKKTVIGVIDGPTNLDTLPQFKKYFVSNVTEIEDDKKVSFDHGNSVASLIIALNELNESSNDNLGNFKIKHFGILGEYTNLKNEQMYGASYMFLKNKLKEIILGNKDIKIWNLSFGIMKRPWTISIWPNGQFLDALSKEAGCLFIVSSGNDGDSTNKNLNSPADSLNALSVGSVELFGDSLFNKAKYSSVGQVIQYVKPEISSLGGQSNSGDNLFLINGKLEIKQFLGTSYAAPKIARLAAQLIEEGYGILETKAKIISMANSEKPKNKSSAFGYVINYINNSDNDLEIKISGSLLGNKPRYYDLNIKGAKAVEITTCIFANPKINLGEEYSISSIEASLIAYNKEYDTLTPEIENKFSFGAVPIKQKPIQDETYLRSEYGKYFTTFKRKYNFKKEFNVLDYNVKYPKCTNTAIRLRRLNLFDVKNTEKLEFSTICIIKFYSKEALKLFKSNNIHVLNEVSVDVEI